MSVALSSAWGAALLATQQPGGGCKWKHERFCHCRSQPSMSWRTRRRLCRGKPIAFVDFWSIPAVFAQNCIRNRMTPGKVHSRHWTPRVARVAHAVGDGEQPHHLPDVARGGDDERVRPILVVVVLPRRASKGCCPSSAGVER